MSANIVDKQFKIYSDINKMYKNRIVVNIRAFDEEGRQVKSHTITLKESLWVKYVIVCYNGKPSKKNPVDTVTGVNKKISRWLRQLTTEYLR